jgi:hypothetical protein
VREMATATTIRGPEVSRVASRSVNLDSLVNEGALVGAVGGKYPPCNRFQECAQVVDMPTQGPRSTQMSAQPCRKMTSS